MKQRAMIAIAISCNPSFLIADEPTTALDVTLQLQILKLIMSLREKLSMGILFISHDLRVVYDISDRISVIYAGKIVESTSKEKLFQILCTHTPVFFCNPFRTPEREVPGWLPSPGKYLIQRISRKGARFIRDALMQRIYAEKRIL